MRKRKFIKSKKFIKQILLPFFRLRHILLKLDMLKYHINIFGHEKDIVERNKYEKDELFPIPPLPLRKRIGSASVEKFLSSGLHCYNDIQNVLKEQGKSLSEFNTILDFGCGCGRTLRWFEMKFYNALFGVDVDIELIKWMNANLKHVTALKNDFLPPLPFDSNKFDLIYSISVFSHLSEDYHIKWLEELQRILKKNGYLVISILGTYCYKPYKEGYYLDNLSEDQKIPEYVYQKSDLDKEGYVFSPKDFKAGYGETFISSNYIYENWSRYFNVIDIIPVSMDRLQDVVLLQKR